MIWVPVALGVLVWVVLGFWISDRGRYPPR